MTDSTLPEAHPLRAGDPSRLGGYEILGRLGEGGQGSVFLGRATGARDFVAIKLLHAGLTADPTARARFVRELEVAKRVARFCTAQILDADVAGDQPYIVSEYVPGSSLYKLVTQEGPRTGGALERLAISTLTALTAIHQAGIVHRDFKPHNVMLGPDGPRVIDFGVARALGAAGETQNVGTPAYMAPEHFTGDPVGPAADLFAWGTTMVFAATGHPAFGNDEMGAVMHRILTGEPDLTGLPEPLRGVVADCLAKDPALRPSARQAQERLVGTGPVPSSAVTSHTRIDATGPQFPATAPPPSPHNAVPPLPDPVPGPVSFAHSPGDPASAQTPPPHPADPTHPTGGSGPAAPDGSTRTVDPPKTGRSRRGTLVSATAAAVVAVVLAGGAIWAAARSGDQEPAGSEGGTAVAGSGQIGNGSHASAGTSGRTANQGGSSPSGDPGKSVSPRDGQASPSGRRSPGGGAPGGDGGGHRGEGGGSHGGGDEPAPEPVNPYGPEQVCDSGGHGGGYYVQRYTKFAGGTVYQLYNSSGYNCAVTLKARDVGKATGVWVKIEAQGGGVATDSGSFQYYAGPVYVHAKGRCVRYSGGSSFGNGGQSWGNCG